MAYRTDYITLPGGTLAFPHRGDHPDVLPGYERVPGDPYILVPVWPPCPHRGESTRVRPCGKLAFTRVCTLLQIVDLKVDTCLKCTELPK